MQWHHWDARKNLVDAENMLGMLTEQGFELTDDESLADVIIVNTCCFINDAKNRINRHNF